LPVRLFDFPGRTIPLVRGYRPFDDESPPVVFSPQLGRLMRDS